ncbi:MAG: glycosyltransferase family 39 protein [Gammaproteobacteria bacterium]|nr:glycosyltransferase family 39 protein [Gammaproteobacteria bacterium]MDH5802540.1 glycosyltransferase family 39 protein [Gammaproteobacteria bacterium]
MAGKTDKVVCSPQRFEYGLRDCIVGAESILNLDTRRLQILLLYLITALVFLLQYVFRIWDDNRLLSWRWTISADLLLPILGFSSVLVLLGNRLIQYVGTVSAKLGLILGSGFGLTVVLWSSPQVIIDSARYLTYANAVATHGVFHFLQQWGSDIAVWTDLPMVPLLYGVLFTLFGESVLVVQVFCSVLFSTTLYLTYSIGKSLWDERTGLVAAGLLLAFPFLLVQVSQVLVDVVAMFFFVLAIRAVIAAVQRQSWVAISTAVALCLPALLSKYNTWVLVGWICIAPFLYNRSGHIRLRAGIKTGFLLLSGVLTLLGSVMAWKFTVFQQQWQLLQGFQLPGLSWWGESHVSTFFYQIHPYVSLAALGAVVVAIRRMDWHVMLAVVLFAGLIILGVARARYFLVFYPILALLASRGLLQLFSSFMVRQISLNAIAMSVVLLVVAYSGSLQSMSMVNLKNAGAYLNKLPESNVVVVVTPVRRTAINPNIALPFLDAYTQKTIYLDPEYTPGPVLATIPINSPVRFTWEFHNGWRYKVWDDASGVGGQCADLAALVIISDGRSRLDKPAWAASYRLSKAFVVTDRVFRYQVLTHVYRSEDCAETVKL